MEQIGEIHSVGETQTVGQNNFRKRPIVLLLKGDDQKPEYPNYCEFEFTKDSCDKLDQFRVGQEVKIQWSLSGRIWEGNGKGPKVFNTLKGWRIELMQEAAPSQPAPAQSAPPAQATVAPASFDDDKDLDLENIPF